MDNIWRLIGGVTCVQCGKNYLPLIKTTLPNNNIVDLCTLQCYYFLRDKCNKLGIISKLIQNWSFAIY